MRHNIGSFNANNKFTKFQAVCSQVIKSLPMLLKKFCNFYYSRQTQRMLMNSLHLTDKGNCNSLRNIIKHFYGFYKGNLYKVALNKWSRNVAISLQRTHNTQLQTCGI